MTAPYSSNDHALGWARRRFWFASHTGTATFPRPGIGLGPLAADRQPFPMAQATVRATVDQSFNIHRESLS